MPRKVAALLIVLAGAAAIYRLCVVPLRCSRIEYEVDAGTEAAFRFAESPGAREAARRNFARLEECLRSCPTNVNLWMLAAANKRIVERNEEALALYETALRYDRRPEIYTNLGVVQAAAGRPDLAVESFVKAGDFSGKEYLLDLPEVSARTRAYAIVAEHEAKFFAARGDLARRSVTANALFAEGGARGTATTGSGANAAFPSAAAAWLAYAGAQGSVSTELVPSTRRPGGKMLHVVTSSKGSGIFQAWSSGGRTVDNVLTDVWILVRRGRVYAGSGNGGSTVADVYSARTGVWERMQGENRSCPATETIVFTASDGADFDVDSVQVHEVPGAPCGSR